MVWASISRRSLWPKAKSRRTSWTHSNGLIVAAWFIGTTALADGFVLTIKPDGQLETQTPQARFAQSYGIGSEPTLIKYRPTKPAQTPPAPKSNPEILTAITRTAQRYGGHPAIRKAGLSVSDWIALFQANIEIESAYRPTARSPVGAIGLGQLMPATAKSLGVDPHDWRANLDGSARYLLSMLDQFGSPKLALAAYNAGPNAVEKYSGIPPYSETQKHVRRVLAVQDRLIGAY